MNIDCTVCGAPEFPGSRSTCTAVIPYWSLMNLAFTHRYQKCSGSQSIFYDPYTQLESPKSNSTMMSCHCTSTLSVWSPLALLCLASIDLYDSVLGSRQSIFMTHTQLESPKTNSTIMSCHCTRLLVHRWSLVSQVWHPSVYVTVFQEAGNPFPRMHPLLDSLE